MAAPDSGTLRDTPLPRLLLALHAERCGDALRLRGARAEKRVLFRDGTPVHVESSRPGEGPAARLAAAGRLSEEDRARVEERIRAGVPEGRALLELGAVDARGLLAALRDAARAQIVECFAWPEGTFEREAGRELPPEVQPLRLDPVALVHEGLARHWDPERLRAALTPRMERYPHPRPGLADLRARLRGSPEAAGLLARLDGSHTLFESLRADQTPSALAAAWLADATGAVGWEDAPSARAEVAPPDAEPEIEVVAEAAPRGSGAARAGGRARAPRARSEEQDYALRREIVERLEQLGRVSYYELLGVEPDAADDAIKRAYLRAAKRYHPDAIARTTLDATARAQANRVFAEIGRAYGTLSDPRRRRSYDARLAGDDSEAEAQRLAQAEGMYRKGEVLLRIGNFDGALEYLRPAVELWPDEAAYQSALGWALYKKRRPDLDGAREHLQRAAELAPDDREIRTRLARLH